MGCALVDVKHFDPDVVLDAVVRLFWERGHASTGIQDVVETTGLSRSSLYATFGGKRELYLAALRRYVEEQSRPVLTRLSTDSRGLTAIAEFFDRLIQARCSGEHARWGCMVSNAHLGTEGADPDVRQVLAQHHHQLRAAMRAALQNVRLRPGVDVDAAAEQLALLAYGVNLRSRSGADAADLRRAVTAALDALREPTAAKETEQDG
jgi:TetR/AcrR family transcriptional regulator, transcriptional repressor for nem operon